MLATMRQVARRMMVITWVVGVLAAVAAGEQTGPAYRMQGKLLNEEQEAVALKGLAQSSNPRSRSLQDSTTPSPIPEQTPSPATDDEAIESPAPDDAVASPMPAVDDTLDTQLPSDVGPAASPSPQPVMVTPAPSSLGPTDGENSTNSPIPVATSDDQETCSNGYPGVQNGAACCVAACGQCGGAGCGVLEVADASENCCSAAVIDADLICEEDTFEAPCVIDNFSPAPDVVPGSLAPFASSTCSNGFEGVQNDAACCAVECGICGGEGCGTVAGTAGSSACCSEAILTNGTACTLVSEAPCYIEGFEVTPSPTVHESAAPVVPSQCSNGLPGYQDKNVCCLMSCGLCGGPGCGDVNGTNGGTDCCPTQIEESNRTCGVNADQAPCVIAETVSPTASPTVSRGPTLAPSISGNARDHVDTDATGRTVVTFPVQLMTVSVAFSISMSLLFITV